jgi:hypothetical protein
MLAAGLAGCVGEPVESPAARSAEPVAEELIMAVEPTAPAGDVAMAPAVLADLTRAAIEDAAQRTSVRVADVTVLSAESVTWPDGSLGCPQPGMNYTQALVPGYRILVQAGGQVLRYHAGTRGAVKFCPEGQAVDPVGGDVAI